MQKIGLVIIFVFCFSFCVGCQNDTRTPLTVTFIDISGAMSTDHTIKISFAEEIDYEDYYIDILVKTNDQDVELTLFQEFASDEDKIKISLNKADGYISLDEYKLFNMEEEQTDSMVGYGDALATILVVNSNKDATLTFIAVIGEKDNGNFKKIGEASQEYTLEVLKHTDK